MVQIQVFFLYGEIKLKMKLKKFQYQKPKILKIEAYKQLLEKSIHKPFLILLKKS